MLSQRVETYLERRSLRARTNSAKHRRNRSSVARGMAIFVFMYANGAQMPPTWVLLGSWVVLWSHCGSQMVQMLPTWSQMTAQECPRAAQERPRAALGLPKGGPRSPKSAQGRPQSTQVRPKGGPRAPKGGPRAPKGGPKAPKSGQNCDYFGFPWLLGNMLPVWVWRRLWNLRRVFLQNGRHLGPPGHPFKSTGGPKNRPR